MQVGLLSAVLIAINNLRDVDEDRKSGKRTLAVRYGAGAVRTLIMVFVSVATLLSLLGFVYGAKFFGLLSLPWVLVALGCVAGVRRTKPSAVYNRFLARAALALMLFAVTFTVAVVI